VSPRRLLISLVQQGIIAQNEFAKLLMMGSRGLIELAAPLTDEERRDFEIHIHGFYGSALAVQVKSVMELVRRSKNVRILECQFAVRASRVVNDPLFWYFFAFLDPKTMRFADPTFLIPSHIVHEQASPNKRGAFWHFYIQASMEPASHDRWEPYRVNTVDLGKKALAIMRKQAQSSLPLAGRVGEGVSPLLDLPGVVLIRKR
jgi:hypothetical protein